MQLDELVCGQAGGVWLELRTCTAFSSDLGRLREPTASQIAGKAVRKNLYPVLPSASMGLSAWRGLALSVCQSHYAEQAGSPRRIHRMDLC